jgi:hypothetical protein
MLNLTYHWNRNISLMSDTKNNYNSMLVIAVVTIAILTTLFEVVPLKVPGTPVKGEEEHIIAVPDSEGTSLVMQKESSLANVNEKTKQQGYEEENQRVPHNQQKRRVLIVDNTIPDITFVFKMGLEDKGFTVDAFEDPVLALSNFKSNYYDIMTLVLSSYLLYYKLMFILI